MSEMSEMSEKVEKCQICKDGNLQQVVGKNSVEYKGHFSDIEMHYSVCDSCGVEQAGAAQTRDNKRFMLAFRKSVGGLLSGSQVRVIRQRMNLKQTEAAAIFGGGPVSFSKYENDDVVQSEAMDRLLRVASEVPGALRRLKRHIDNEVAVVAGWMETQIAPGGIKRPITKQHFGFNEDIADGWMETELRLDKEERRLLKSVSSFSPVCKKDLDEDHDQQ